MEHEEGFYGNCPDSNGNSEYLCKTHEEGLKQSEKFNEFQNCEYLLSVITFGNYLGKKNTKVEE